MDKINKEEVKEIVNSEIQKFINNSLDNEIRKNLRNSSSKSRSELIVVIKNSLEAVYKLLWQKRDFWKSDIK